jgi:hypothetical protein
MSGASVSSTMASSGRVAANSRMRLAGKAHGAAETQLEAQLDEFVGLLPAAVEGMGDAAGHPARLKCLSTGSMARRTCSSTGSSVRAQFQAGRRTRTPGGHHRAVR